MVDDKDINPQSPIDEIRRQEEVQAEKRTNRTLELYDNTFENALPDGIAAFLRNRSQPTWVDLCCGDGLALKEAALSEGCEAAEIIGIDLRKNTPMTAHSEYDPNIRRNGVSYSRQNLDGNNHIIMPTNCDLITCLMGDRYIRDVMPMILQAINSLAKDGLFLITRGVFHTVRYRQLDHREMLEYYLKRKLRKIGGGLEVVEAGNKDSHMGYWNIRLWVIKRGDEDITFNYKMSESRELYDGGYWQEYWVDP